MTQSQQPRAAPTRQQFGRELVDVLHDLPVFRTAPLYRAWHLNRGATVGDERAALPGDSLVGKPQYRSTRASTIDAPPEAVWPWLVQVGCRRACFYSNELLDNLARPSATTIVPAWRHLEVGQWVPISPFATPTERTALRVGSFLVGRWLLWTTPGRTAVWRLRSVPNGGTHLVTRIHTAYDWKNPPLAILGLLLMEFGHCPMLRRMLRGIKQRAEVAQLQSEMHKTKRLATPVLGTV